MQPELLSGDGIGVSPPLPPDATGFGRATACTEGQPDAVAHVDDASPGQSMRSARWVPGGTAGVVRFSKSCQAFGSPFFGSVRAVR